MKRQEGPFKTAKGRGIEAFQDVNRIFGSIPVTKKDTHPVSVEVQCNELPLGEPLVEAEAGLAVEQVGDAGGPGAGRAVGHPRRDPVKQRGQEPGPLLTLPTHS